MQPLVMQNLVYLFTAHRSIFKLVHWYSATLGSLAAFHREIPHQLAVGLLVRLTSGG